jgi:exosortase
MLSTPTLQAIPVPVSASRRLGWEIVAAAVAAAIAYLPLLARHVAWLWQRPHYQFFPLVLVGAGVLAYLRMRNTTARRTGSAAVTAIALSAAWLLLAIADFLVSPWLGCISCMILLITLIYAVGGRDLCRQALPAWAFLWLVVPPPMDLDRLLMFKLQNLTTGWSSAILDLFGVFHVRFGNVIEVDGRKMMVEQACSGINSLYSLLACTLFMVFLTRRGWVHGILLVAAAIVWVLSANVARVTGVVLIESRWGVNVSTGWRHETFGVIVFAVAVGLLLCTEQFFSFLSRSSPKTLESPPSPPNTPVTSVFEEPASVGNRRVMAAVIPAYLLLAIGYWIADKPSFDTERAGGQLPTPDKDRLPKKIGSWELTESATQTREASSFYGEHSAIWVYSRTRHTAVVSLDFPFPSWHDLTWCYAGKGWQIDSQTVRNDLEVPGGFLEVRLSQPTYRHGYLVFCEFDRHGQPFTARPGGTEASLFRHQTTLQRIRNRLGFDSEPGIEPSGPVYQLQVFWEGYDKLSNEDEAAVVDLFVRAGATLRASCTLMK